jgi:hypothetical protein
MKRRFLIGGAVLAALVLAYLGGYYSYRPRVVERVKVETKIETRTEWRDREVVRRVQGPERIRTVVREVPGPAGPERVIVRVVERGPETTETLATWDGVAATDTATTETASKVTEPARPGWAAGAAALLDPEALWDDPRLALELDRRIWGTVWLGARAQSAPDLSDARVGVAARVEW